LTPQLRRDDCLSKRVIFSRVEDLLLIYLLDTSAISLLMREDPAMASWLSSVSAQDRLIVCTITRGEILFGLGRLAQGKRRTELELKAKILFSTFPCEAIPAAAADFYANLKLAQQRRGLSLDENDLWIASAALAMEATLVTRDTDFRNIETLAVLTP
jgi:predicted nucleic acid-binding protein